MGNLSTLLLGRGLSFSVFCFVLPAGQFGVKDFQARSLCRKTTVLNCVPQDYLLYWAVGFSVLTGCDFFSIYFLKYCHVNLR